MTRLPRFAALLLCGLAACQTDRAAEQPAAPAPTASGEDAADEAPADDDEDTLRPPPTTGDADADQAEEPERHPGKFVRFELISSRPDDAAAFYHALFGWRVDRADDDGDTVYQIRNRARFLGRIRSVDPGRKLPQGWVSWVSVLDVDDMMRDVESNGGTIVEAPRTVRRERRALVKGPTGGVFGIVRADDGDGPDTNPRDGDWYWSQLWTKQFQTAMNFYPLVGGYSTIKYTYQDVHYLVLEGEARRRAVVVHAPAGQASRWLPVVQVAAVEETVQRARSLRAAVLIAPRQVSGVGQLAVLRSPAGGVFGVITPNQE